MQTKTLQVDCFHGEIKNTWVGDGCADACEDDFCQAEIQMVAYRIYKLYDKEKVRVNFSDVLTEEEKMMFLVGGNSLKPAVMFKATGGF